MYRGEELSSLKGTYIFGDFCNGSLYGTNVEPVDNQRQDLLETSLSISSFAQDSEGELLVLNLNGGPGAGIYRLRSTQPDSETGAIARKLSETGCFDNAVSQTPAEGVMPYPVNSQLWSDGADKSRFFAIPDETTIDVSSSGDLEFPIGSVLIKSFFHLNSPVETRLFMRHNNGWAGYSYAWNSDGSDADLLDTGMKSAIDDSYAHIFPSRSQCMRCHLHAAGFTLGLESAQLNQSYTPNGESPDNYLARLEQLGYFSESLTAAQQQNRLSALDDESASVEARARSYLHSNCSGCHRPGGPIAGLDLRYSTALEATGACAQAPLYGDLGVTGAALISPGDASHSLLSLRMRELNVNRMPPLSSDVADDRAISIIESWINSLGACNE